MKHPRAYSPTRLEVPPHFTPEQTLAVLREIGEGVAAFNRWAEQVYRRGLEGQTPEGKDG